MAKDNKYAKVEGLLYSYSTLPFRKKNLEIDLKINEDEEKRKELEQLELTMEKIDNILEMLKQEDEIDYLIIKLRYLDKLTWEQIEQQLHMSVCQLILRRKNIILNKLLAML